MLRIAGRLFLSLWLTNKYADNRWLLERYEEDAVHGLKMRHLLYHAAVRWFPVQLLGLTGKSIAEQRFVREEDGIQVRVAVATGEGQMERLDQLGVIAAELRETWTEMGSRQATSRRWAQLPPSNDEPYRLDVRREPVAAGHDGGRLL